MAIDPFLVRQIIGVAEAALREADAVDVLPTPLERVAEVAGITAVVNTADLPDELLIAKPKAWRRVLGAYLYRADTAFVDLSQPVGRRRFILAHETGHKIVPWHEDSYHLDDERRLFADTEEELEEEANFAGKLLIFQGGRFHSRALDYATGMATPIALAGAYGASMHACIRFYTEQHPEPVGLVIAGRYARADGTVPIWCSVESKSFAERFGSFRFFFPERGVPLIDAQASHPLGALATAAYGATDVVTEQRSLRDLRGDQVRCDIDTFFNQRCLFIMAHPRALIRRGRRMKVEAI